jgi:hypothetical protein
MGNGQQSFYFAQGVAQPSETVRPTRTGETPSLRRGPCFCSAK